MLIMHIL